MERVLGHDFSRVRIHVDPAGAGASAAVGAHAFTVGRHVVFGAERYAPGSQPGRRLLAHELTHVAQQAGASSHTPSRLLVAPAGDAAEAEAEATAERLPASLRTPAGADADRPGPVTAPVQGVRVQRVNVSETAAVLDLGTTPGTGLQFVPVALRGTRIGPVSGRGGLVDDTGAQRVSVIVGSGVTLRQLAGSLLPLWETATPFVPEGSTTQAPRIPLDADTLARGLMAYNRALLRPPAMDGWRAGLRFPLPIRVDPETGEGVLHPLVVVGHAGEFDAAWEPLLDQGAAATATPTADDLAAAVEAFLTAEPTALGRGIFLGARVLTNAPAEREFVVAVLDRLGSEAFAAALELMNNVVNHQLELLAAQTAGAAILERLRIALAAPPADLDADSQRQLERARGMLARVTGITARETPALGPVPAAAHGAGAAARPAAELEFSAEGAAFIAEFEGFRGDLYDDAAGHCTIGFGHLVHRGNCNGTEPQEFRGGIGRERALDLLQEDAGDAAAVVQAEVDVDLTQAQFDALVSFTFNVGGGAFRGSTLLQELNAGHYDEVPNQLDRWTRAGGEVLGGLVRRRTAEGNLFQNGVYR